MNTGGARLAIFKSVPRHIDDISGAVFCYAVGKMPPPIVQGGRMKRFGPFVLLLLTLFAASELPKRPFNKLKQYARMPAFVPLESDRNKTTAGSV